MTIQKRYCSVPCFYSWYRTVPFLYQLFTVYQKPAPIRYCPVPCLYRLSGTRYRYTVLDGIGTMCKTVPFGTFPIPCTGNTVSEQYQFLPYNSTGMVPSSTVMFTGNILACTFLVFNKNAPQAATRETSLQMLKIEQRHRMTSCTWGRGCPTKSVIDHRTWSIIGHSTIWISVIQYYNYEKYPLSPLKPRGLALLSWHVPYNWGSENSVHQSFKHDSCPFTDVNPHFTAPGCRYYFKINSWWPIVTS